MRFGLFGGARTSIGEQPSDSRQLYEFIDYVTEAEALGFESVFLVEHHFTGFGQVSASLNLLAYLAARTTSMRLGTAVTVLPWHNPALLAEQAATVDVLSGGRLDLGVGRGYRYREFHGFCMPWRKPRRAIRNAWRSFARHGPRLAASRITARIGTTKTWSSNRRRCNGRIRRCGSGRTARHPS